MRQNHKDRLTILSHSVLNDLRTYFKEWKPKHYLFEGAKRKQYTSTSILKIIKNAAKKGVRDSSSKCLFQGITETRTAIKKDRLIRSV